MTKKTKSLMATTIVVTTLTFFFKILGFVKQAVVAYYFGTTFETDIYNVAFSFVGSLSAASIKAISISLVSNYTYCLIQKGRDAASRLLSASIQMMLPIVVVVLFFANILTPQIAKILAPTYSASESILLQHYLHACFPFFIFTVITLIWTVLMDSNKDFIISRTESFITSTVTIACCILLYQTLAVKSLLLAQYLSYTIFCLLLIIRGRRYFTFSLTKIQEVPELKMVLLTAIPLFVGNSVSQINKIVDNSVSTSLGHGNVTALGYAVVLEDFVCNILVNNVVDILYVNFSTYVAEGNHDRLTETMKHAINIMICIMVPITIVTCLCSNEIVSIAFRRGNFDEDSLIMTSSALIGYAIGFTSSGVRDIVLRVLYSFKDTTGPMITGFFAVAANVFFSIFLSKYIGIMGVSIASSICLTVNFLINSQMVKKHVSDFSIAVHIPIILKQLPASVALVIIIYAIKHIFNNNFIVFILCSIFGLSVYTIILSLMSIEEITLLKQKVILKIKQRGN